MDNTNLFKHGAKEFVTDAFFTWLLYFLDSRVDLTYEKNNFFSTLLLKEKDRNKSIREVDIPKPKKGKHGRPDVVLTFNLDNDKKEILLENKTWATTTWSQLSGYRKDYDNLYRYFYLKLAYVNIKEKLLCKEIGYDIISSEDLYDSIVKLKKHHPFIEQYAEYLKCTFVDKINDLKTRIKEGDFTAFSDAQGQQIFVSALYQKLADLDINNLVFKTGSSSGRPWTELDICSSNVNYKSEGVNKTITETIFWRVDIRAKKYYVRLNQYSYNPPREYICFKKKRLAKLREISKKLISEYRQLYRGKVVNRGNAESEIVIFFEDKNSINDLLQVLPSLSKKFIEEYNKINNHA